MMQAAKPDLVVSDLLVEFPARKLIIKTADVHPGRLTLIEALDIMEASSIPSTQFVDVMQTGSLRQKAALIYAMAWVVARRAEPGLTYEEVCTYQVEVIGEPVEVPEDRADAVVAVAALAGVSPEEAKRMTIAEVAALTKLHKKRSVRQGPKSRRRRVG